MRHLKRLFPLAGFVALLFAGPAFAEDYRLQPGDVLQFSILSANPISERLVIDLGGQINVPVGGRFEAGGLTLEELRQAVVGRLKVGSFPIGRDENGRAVWDAVFPEAIVLDIAEYRPVFMSGDILTPGAQPFRPGMTVRQAISVAGGASPFRTRQDPSLELLGAKEQELALLARETSLRFQAARIEAELAEAEAPAFDAVPDNGLDAGKRAALRQSEQDLFDTRRQDFTEHRNTISQGILTIEKRSELLAESQKNLEEENRSYHEELERVEALFSKGLVQVGRLNDAQRLVFLVASRALDTSAEVARLDRELVEMRRSYEEASTDRRMQNLANQKQASLDLLSTQAELERLRQRLQFFQPRDSEPTVELVRGETQGVVAATLDTAVMPGDTVVVRLNDVPAASGAAREASAPAEAKTASNTASKPVPKPTPKKR
ncbi:polysaccharide biosynthesis/export family protein [Aureimonas phyllosphaerae]|uniref:polysaccharide biosynthesis/export family protein n=1 Tax=Aureimonas phyllosphaerae TaxID=1166078 RepID=UPI003A5C26A3